MMNEETENPESSCYNLIEQKNYFLFSLTYSFNRHILSPQTLPHHKAKHRKDMDGAIVYAEL